MFISAAASCSNEVDSVRCINSSQHHQTKAAISLLTAFMTSSHENALPMHDLSIIWHSVKYDWANNSVSRLYLRLDAIWRQQRSNSKDFFFHKKSCAHRDKIWRCAPTSLRGEFWRHMTSLGKLSKTFKMLLSRPNWKMSSALANLCQLELSVYIIQWEQNTQPIHCSRFSIKLLRAQKM